MSKTPAPKKTPKAPVAKQPATASRKAAARKAAATTAADRKAAAIEAGPPFIRDTLPNGEQAWRMSPALAKRYDELKRFVEIQDKEIQAAAVALLIAEHRLISNRNEDAEDYEQRPASSTESGPAFTGFMMPLARRLHTLRLPENSLPHRREEIRKEAVAWFQNVIQNAFAEYIEATQLEQEAVKVIEALRHLCEELGRHATKKDLKKRGGLNWERSKWREVFHLAGLSDLHESGRERY